jgi:crooked neck
VLLLEAWKDFEENYGDEETQKVVKDKEPKVVKKRRKAEDSTDDNVIWEEYFDYIFPDDQEQSRNLKLLQMAQAWQAKVRLFVYRHHHPLTLLFYQNQAINEEP